MKKNGTKVGVSVDRYKWVGQTHFSRLIKKKKNRDGSPHFCTGKQTGGAIMFQCQDINMWNRNRMKVHNSVGT